MNSKYLLCIDASVQTASVALSNEDGLLGIKICEQQREHAAFIQPAIQDLLKEQTIQPSNITAVAVTSGPGSYTGLRVAMASAKGLCYAIQIPLITINTLELISVAALQQTKIDNNDLLCPLIDARRMEVFTAVYTSSLQIVAVPQAMILNEDSFQEFLSSSCIHFFGNGAEKWKSICSHMNAKFANVNWNASHMTKKAWDLYQTEQFASLAYATPFYGKDFYSTSKL